MIYGRAMMCLGIYIVIPVIVNTATIIEYLITSY